MIARTAQEWIDIIADAYQGRMDEPLMLDWIDRHHAEPTLGRRVRKATFTNLVARTGDWYGSDRFHEALQECES